MSRLATPPYMAFPFRIDATGPGLSDRQEHIREQIEQVLFTHPGERVFRPDFGAGVRALVFEPNDSALWELTKKRLLSSLADVLAGEVDPRTLEVDVTGEDAELRIVISYTLATIGHSEQQVVNVGSGSGG